MGQTQDDPSAEHDDPARHSGEYGEHAGQHVAGAPPDREFLGAVFEQSAIGIAIVELDGRPVVANAALERFLGYSVAELSQLTYHAITFPEDLALDAKNAAELAAGTIDGYVVEKRYVRKDSRVVWGRLTVSLLRSAAGDPEYVLAMVEDITDRKRAESALRDTEARFRAAFDGSGVGMAIVGEGGELLKVNQALAHFLGYPAEALVGRRFADLTHPDELGDSVDLVRKLREGDGHSYQMEKRYLHAAGHVVWGLLTISLVRDASGAPLYLLSQLQDITEWRAAQEALRASERRYRHVVETTHEGIWTIDASGRTDYVNPRMAEMLGYAPEEMLGRSMYDFMDQEAREEADANMERRRRGVRELHEFRLRTREGAALWTLMSTNPIVDEGGRFTGALAMVTDITERKRAESALRESESRYRGLVELAPDGILVHCDGGVIFVNETAARLFGAASVEELIGHRVMDLVHPEYRERVRERIAALREATPAVPVAEERLLRRDGTSFEAEISATAVTYEGRPAVQAIVRDITERRRAEATLRDLEEQLRQAQKMEAVGQLAGGVAHDFNNLLTVIGTYSDFLLEELGETSPFHADVLEIQRAAGRAASLTRQLLAFSRKQLLQPKLLDLNVVARGIEPMLRRLIGEDIGVVLRPAPRVARVRADAGQLEQVIVNLAVNARDAMPRGGTLTIATADVQLDDGYAIRRSAVVPGDYVALCVSDTGHGMDERTRSRAFEPFFTTKPVGQGTGLGLSTVYGIVKQSGGYIWCYSEPGHGTTFKIYLPRAEEGDARPGVRPAEPADIRGSEVLLLVEDEDAVRALARRILERYGYTVLEARDGQDAVGVASRYPERIHGLVTDMVMPGLTGRDVYRALVAERPELRVLYMSGYTDDDILRRGLLDAGSAFLQKPFTALGLARAVRAVLDGRELASEPVG